MTIEAARLWLIQYDQERQWLDALLQIPEGVITPAQLRELDAVGGRIRLMDAQAVPVLRALLDAQDAERAVTA